MNKKIAALALSLAFATPGCAWLEGSYDQGFDMQAAPQDSAYAHRFYREMRGMAKELSVRVKDKKESAPMVVVTTFVPTGEYETATRFGTLASEQMLIGLSEAGFRVYDMRRSRSVLVKEQDGFFSLSNRLKYINPDVRTDLVMAGSYALVNGEMMVSAMLINAQDGEVVSTATRTLSLKGDPFLSPIAKPLGDGRKVAGFQAEEEGLVIREPLLKGDNPAKALDLTVEKVSRQVVGTMKPGSRRGTVIVATYVDLDNLNRTNSFGRYVSEKLMEELSKKGFSVLEVRAADQLHFTPRVGETLLSRTARRMMEAHNADAVVLGTYQRLGETVKVFTRMVTPSDIRVVAVSGVEIKAPSDDEFIKALFQNELEKVGYNQRPEGYRK